jgi:hypothetical protein
MKTEFRNDIEKAYDMLMDSTEKAKALISAIRELGHMDNVIDFDLIQHPTELTKSENWNDYVIISEVLRLHDTVSGLCYTLAGEIDEIIKARDLIEDALNHSSPNWKKQVKTA